jgi:polyhydroxyalkanoate synthesis regulator phasin
MQDAWRAYLELALGLTEASRRRAEKVARDLLDRGGATAGQVQSFVEELVTTSRANREELSKLVRYEVDRALGAMGLATAEEQTQLAERVELLERRLREQSMGSRLPEPAGAAVGPAAGPGAGAAAAGPAAAKRPAKQVAKKATKATKAGQPTKVTKATKAGQPTKGTGKAAPPGKRTG